jgi:hypothetical protein
MCSSRVVLVTKTFLYINAMKTAKLLPKFSFDFPQSRFDRRCNRCNEQTILNGTWQPFSKIFASENVVVPYIGMNFIRSSVIPEWRKVRINDVSWLISRWQSVLLHAVTECARKISLWGLNWLRTHLSTSFVHKVTEAYVSVFWNFLRTDYFGCFN